MSADQPGATDVKTREQQTTSTNQGPHESDDVGRVVGVEEHAWTTDLREALLRWGGDETVNSMSSRGVVNDRLLEMGEERLGRMDAAGIDVAVLSITSPGTQQLTPVEAVPLAKDANDTLADAVRRHPDRFAAYATLPTPDPAAAADELRRSVTQLGLVGAMVFPRAGEEFLDSDRFRPIFEAAADLDVPLFIHPTLPPHSARRALYGGFDDWTSTLLATGGWGWHMEAGLSALRLILAGTFDRHPNLQLVLGRWGELLVGFADRADLMSSAAPGLERRVLDYIASNINVNAGGVLSHRMMAAALAVLGPDRLMYGSDDPYGAPSGRAAVDSRGAY